MAQELRREPPVRLPNPSAQPFVAALKTVRFFAVLFFWLTMVCLLAHVAAFVCTEWIGLYEMSAEGPEVTSASASGGPRAESPEAGSGPAVSSPAAEEGVVTATQGAEPTAVAAKPKETARGMWAAWSNLTPTERRDVTVRLLRPLRSLGILSALLLWVTLFVYLQIALLGRLAGIRPLTAALFLVLVCVATVIPWHRVFLEVEFGSFFDFSTLLRLHDERVAGGLSGSYDTVGYFGRFLALPILSVLLLAWAGVRFGGGYRESVVANE